MRKWLAAVGVAAVLCGVAGYAAGPYGSQYCDVIIPSGGIDVWFSSATGYTNGDRIKCRGRLSDFAGSADPISFNLSVWLCDYEDDPAELNNYWCHDTFYDLNTSEMNGQDGSFAYFPSYQTIDDMLDGGGRPAVYVRFQIWIDPIPDTNHWEPFSDYGVLIDL